MKLKKLRLEANKTQTEMARILNMSQTGYGQYETGRIEPDIKTLIKLADYFHVTVDALIDHNVPFLLDKSILNPQCQKVIDEIITLNERQCEKLYYYIIGMKAAEEEKQNIISKFKGD